MARILVTTSRLPVSLDEIRKFGHRGHEVYATDTFATAPGSHSRYTHEAIITPQPRFEPAAFRAAILDIIRSRGIELLVPTYEEVFYLVRHMAQFSAVTEVFAPPFETIAALHDKVRFLGLARELGLATPRTIVVSDEDSLVAATREIGRYFARPAYSRSGVSLVTNAGPLAGVVPLRDCKPTATNPWVVQDFVEGTDVCSFSVVHHGRVAAHCSYVHPKAIEHAGGVLLESVVEPATLAATRAIVEATGYHGQISLDFMRLSDGTLQVVECNPRPTTGVVMMPDDMFVDAVLEPELSDTKVAPAGSRHKISMALVRDMVRNWRNIPSNVAALLSDAKEIYSEPGDVMPALWQLLSYSHVFDYRRQMAAGRHSRTDLLTAYFYDVCWDGEPLD
jgi:predicted ATP-grasp superfamily ATP-dependent carboligase